MFLTTNSFCSLGESRSEYSFLGSVAFKRRWQRKEKDENKPKQQRRSVGAVTRSYSNRNVSTFSLLLHFTEFLQVTWLVLLFPFYSHRQTLRRMISHPHPIGATATHGTDLLFILKCLSHPPRSVCARRGGDWEERGCGGALQCR